MATYFPVGTDCERIAEHLALLQSPGAYAAWLETHVRPSGGGGGGGGVADSPYVSSLADAIAGVSQELSDCVRRAARPGAERTGRGTLPGIDLGYAPGDPHG